ncbi:MAG: ribosome biogenesis GTPase YlqF [Candidatus Methylopumilus sp.]|nr:ribosome biogenesis GTPase YlqF [Candidatus Methylopumilus sp.]
MSIQWFPGHMVAAQKKAAETMEFTDVVIEVLDARIPGASQNPMIKELRASRQRAHLKVLNKSDLADPKITGQWINYFNKLPKTKAIAISCKKINEPKKILALCKDLALHRSTSLKPLRMMIMGVPNVGKSTLMNALLNKRIAKVGDEPAITKQQQRHQINDHMILVDTPGMMWPKIHYELDSYLLASNYAIGKNAYFEEEVAEKLGSILLELYPTLLESRYKLENLNIDSIALLEWIAKKKGFPLKNHGVDLERASATLLNDYRQGSLGRISLESPQSRAVMMSSQTHPLKKEKIEDSD